MDKTIGQDVIDAIDSLEPEDKYDREKVMTAMAEAIIGQGAGEFPSDDGLVAHYSLDDGQGVGGAVASYHLDGNALDLSGNGNHGTETDITYIDSDYGKVAVFNGTTSFIEVLADGKGSVFDTQEFTIACRFKMPAITQYGHIWSYDFTSHVAPYYGQHIDMRSTGSIYFGWNHSGVHKSIRSPTNLIKAGEWAHIVITYKSGEQKLYIDTILRASDSLVGTITYYNQEVWVGKSLYGVAQEQEIDELMFFDRALSDAEILELYNNPSNKNLNQPSLPTEGLVGEWDLNGNSNDTSGSGYNGIINGTPDWVQGRKENQALDNNDASGIYNTNIDYNSSLWSISVRCKPEEGATLESNSVICRFAESGDARRMMFYVEEGDDNIKFYINNSVADSGAAFTMKIDGALVYEWQSLIVTFDGATVKGYYNGALISTTTFSGTVMADFAILGIGCKSSNNVENFQGEIEGVKFFDRVLTEQEILSLAEKTNPVKDNSGNGNDGYSTGLLSSVQGVSGKALSFENKDKEVRITKGLPSGDISISLWFKGLKSSAVKMMFNQEGGGDRQIYIGSDNSIIFNSRGSNGTTFLGSSAGSSAWVENEWTHVVGIQEGLVTKVYCNSILVDTDTHTDIYTSFLPYGYLGSNGATFHSEELVDEVRIYNRALTEIEIRGLYKLKAKASFVSDSESVKKDENSIIEKNLHIKGSLTVDGPNILNYSENSMGTLHILDPGVTRVLFDIAVTSTWEEADFSQYVPKGTKGLLVKLDIDPSGTSGGILCYTLDNTEITSIAWNRGRGVLTEEEGHRLAVPGIPIEAPDGKFYYAEYSSSNWFLYSVAIAVLGYYI